MKLNDIFIQRKKRLNALVRVRKNQPEQVKCPECGEKLWPEDIKKNACICSYCGHYFHMRPSDRIRLIADEDSFREMYAGLKSNDPLAFPEYKKKLKQNREKSGREEAVITGVCKIGGIKTAVAVMDSRFLMGSMGVAVGEKITRITEYAERKKYPLIIFTASGGARMQEGLFSLMQMAKTSAAVERFKEKGGLYISCLTNPTTGGVSASFASLGDIIIAEPKALICFAGPRVIEQTIGQKLPEGFQKSEFLLEHGMLDMIVERHDMKEVLVRILRLHSK